MRFTPRKKDIVVQFVNVSGVFPEKMIFFLNLEEDQRVTKTFACRPREGRALGNDDRGSHEQVRNDGGDVPEVCCLPPPT